jgi:hypothetical protein
MIYTLNDLLMKMGAPEVKEKNHIRWHYFDRVNNEIAGFAEIRLIDGGQRLIAELQHLRHNYEDDTGKVHSTYTESFYLHAEKTGTRYKVTKIAFDEEEYPHPQKSVIELGLSIFHARALDISILMVEQAFNKQDILNPPVDEYPQFRNIPIHVKDVLKKEPWGIVVPFRPRAEARAYRQ